MAKSISMDVDETLEIDYSVEEFDSDIINVNKSTGFSKSYYSTDTFVFDPSETGLYDINLDGEIIEVEVTDASDNVVDWFERDSLTSPTADDWSSYTIDTESARVQSTTVLEGESSLEIDAGKSIKTQRSSPYAPTEIKFLVQATDTDGVGGDGHRVIIQNSGTWVMWFDLEEDGRAEAGLGNHNLGSWSSNSTYLVRLFNIDFNNNQFDAELIDYSTDTIKGSDSNISFENSVSGIDEIVFYRNNSNGGSTEKMYVDSFRSYPIV
jgi:hypothetical protein